MKLRGLAAMAVVMAGAAWGAAAWADEVDVTVISDNPPSAPAALGLEKLEAALHGKHLGVEVVGPDDATRGRMVIRAQVSGKEPVPAESFSIRVDDSGIVLASGDAVGMMYAEMQLAEEMANTSDIGLGFGRVQDVSESPFTRQRAVTIYTMSRVAWESRFYDRTYWARYLDMLAENRFNGLYIVFGYGNRGFTAPLYPYFFDTEGFPDVHLVGLSAEQQKRNVEAMQSLIKMCHNRGIKLTIGIWDHIYRGGLQFDDVLNKKEPAPEKPTAGFVWGVTDKNLVAYNTAAFGKFLKTFPGIDGLQFRMHGESGLKKEEQDGFWHAMYPVLKENAPNVLFEARAKGLPDSEIADALEQGIRFRVNTKFWMEKTGLPFHPTHINPPNQKDRRHSYADLLKNPKTYPMEFGLWNGGTNRILLWGDPEYARRFVEACRLHDAGGFDVDEPLATKMKGRPDDAEMIPLFTEKYEPEGYEFERYWHFFQVFGRMGYDPGTPANVFEREFAKHFEGAVGVHLAAALHRGSWILPRIVASCYRYADFPMGNGWVEKSCLGDLATYAKGEGTDTAQFAGFEEEAAMLANHGVTAKTRPEETASWFLETASELSKEIDAAEESAKLAKAAPGKEYVATVTDLKILRNLAQFHGTRIPAALNFDLYGQTRNVENLKRALEGERAAREVWKKLVAEVGDVYSDDLAMGPEKSGLSGHWRDELAVLDRSVGELEGMLKGAKSDGEGSVVDVPVVDGKNVPVVKFRRVPLRIAAGKDLRVTVKAEGAGGATVEKLLLCYRAVNQTLDFKSMEMKATGNAGEYAATIPAGEIDPTYDLMHYFEVFDTNGRGKIYPDFNVGMPYVITQVVR